MGKYIKSADGYIISLVDIIDTRLILEERWGRTGRNTWEVWAFTSEKVWVTIFRAEYYDNRKDHFYSFEAVKGNNYKIANRKYKNLTEAVKKEKESLEFITI